MFYPVRTPLWFQWLFPGFIWRYKPSEYKKIYLTFDDGPIPDITPWVLNQLSRFNAKATFFCVGANVKKNPEIYQQILDCGHQVGNHTFNHLNGWTVSTANYLNNVDLCSKYVKSPLFRPPYGKISPNQIKLLKENYKIVLWDVIAGDFDPLSSGEKTLKNIINNASDGSIVVLHDNIKSWDRLEFILPKVLKYYSDSGFSFESVPTE